MLTSTKTGFSSAPGYAARENSAVQGLPKKTVAIENTPSPMNANGTALGTTTSRARNMPAANAPKITSAAISSILISRA